MMTASRPRILPRRGPNNRCICAVPLRSPAALSAISTQGLCTSQAVRSDLWPSPARIHGVRHTVLCLGSGDYFKSDIQW